MALNQFQTQVVNDCAAAREKAYKDFDMRHYVVLLDDYVVKFNSRHILYEGDTQAYAYEAAFWDRPNAPRVPKVLDCFLWKGTGYLVMERIHNPDIQKWLDDAPDANERESREKIAHEYVATALGWLFKLPAPPDACIGPIEGAFALANSTMRHFATPVHEPCKTFVNKILTLRPSSAAFMEVDFTDEPLLMVHDDINPSNFLIDPETMEITIIDFGDICVLPRSFISFSLSGRQSAFIKSIAEHLRVEDSKNLKAMFEATYMCCLASGKHFLIDENGSPIKSSKRVI